MIDDQFDFRGLLDRGRRGSAFPACLRRKRA
jgi:hypothetical protein